jgi:parvulin-like peptidyl-prolyl isomerase
MKNKKIIIAISSLAILAIASFATYNFYTKSSDQKSVGENIVANYKGGYVTANQAQIELNKLAVQNPDLKGIAFESLNNDQKEIIIKEIVLKEMAYKEAKKERLNKEKDYKQALKLFETELLKQKLFVKITEDAKKEENLKKNYDELVKNLKDKQDIRISYIALKTQKEANSLHKILTKYPNSFAKQAKLKSIDKETAKNGGDLDFIIEDALPKEIVDNAKQLEKGEISKAFKLADKWVIIKLEDLRPAKIAKFEDAKQALATSLSQKALQDFISESIQDANISIVVK